MMPLKSILFFGLFVFCVIGGFFAPIWSALGYMAHYCIGPERQWWAAPINRFGIRYSFTLAGVTALAILVHWRRLRFGRSLLVGQEKLLLLFLGIIWLSVLIGPATVGRYTRVDHPSVKFTKVVIFALMLTHIATNFKILDRVLWVLVLGAMVLGMQAWDLPRSAMIRGRLNTVGGPDFSEANALSAYLVAILPIIGVQFVRSRWVGKAVCFVAGGFAANAIILTRSRGAVMGAAAAATAGLVLAPKRHRVKIFVGMIIAGLGTLYLMDPQFKKRTMTIFAAKTDRDRSAQARIEIWTGAIAMFKDHPMGVGAGNFYQNIGKYAPRHPRMGAHNAYLRVACELGILGVGAFVWVIINALRTLRRLARESAELPDELRARSTLIAHALIASTCAFAACSLTMGLAYLEGFWWVLLLPACLMRAVDNELSANQGALSDRQDQDDVHLARQKRRRLGVSRERSKHENERPQRVGQ